ncbi:hypothetical protein OCU04_009305 [Sclerotinia nivalis]|uniref:Uncharacterized protein n=1 Tax=Sclerotinia nivalis TaxID=352851 RepID=A0A9X0AET3_9HELO|nr:hypothetical protein OCU04_009305 [Sclerotinia nivalis]
MQSIWALLRSRLPSDNYIWTEPNCDDPVYSAQLSKPLVKRGITTLCAHPGCLFLFLCGNFYLLNVSIEIETNLWRHMPGESDQQPFAMMLMKTSSQGISTACVAAQYPKLSGELSFMSNIWIA